MCERDVEEPRPKIFFMAPAAAGRHREHLSRQAQHHISPADARRGETRRQRCSAMMRIERTSAGMATRAGSGSAGCSSTATHGNATLTQQAPTKAQARRATTKRGNPRMEHPQTTQKAGGHGERRKWRARLPILTAFEALPRRSTVQAKEHSEKSETWPGLGRDTRSFLPAIPALCLRPPGTSAGPIASGRTGRSGARTPAGPV